MSEQQNGFSRMNNVNHSGGTNRPSSGPARSEGSASRRFSNIPLARKIEALILAVVTVIASASVDWSSLTAVAEDGYRSTLNTVVDLPSSNEIVWTYTGRAKGGSDNPYDAVRSAFMNISISGGTADYYVNIYQNYSGNDYTHAKVINNGKGVSTDPIATNQTTDGSFYDYSLWNYGESDANLSPVILSQGEKVAVVVTFVKNSASTVIQYCEGQNEDGDTVSLETNITGIAKFTDSVLEGGENPIIMTTDGGTVSFPNRFYLNPEYMRGVWGVISGSQIVSLNWDARELTPQSDGVTTMVVSADGATSLNVPVVVVSKGNTSYEKTYDGQSFNGISPSCGGYALSEGTDYVASYSGDYLQAGSAASDVINAGNYQVLVTGQGTYSGLNYTQDIVIDRKDISDGNGGLNSSPGTGISLVTPANIVVNAENSTVTSADNALYDQQTGKALSYGTDFTVGPAVRTSGLNTYSITFYGAGNYTGSATVSVNATAYNKLTDISALVQDISFVDEVDSPAAVDITFDGKSHKPYVVLKDQNGFTLPLTAGTDYSYQIQTLTGVTVYDSTSNTSNGVKEAGTYKVIITGLNSNGSGYTGSVDSSKLATPATFTVKPRTLLPGNFVLQLSPNTFFYNGTQDQHPTTVTAYYPYTDDSGNPQNWPMDSNDFDITYETYSKGTSTYTVSVTGKETGNFTGTVNFRNFTTQATQATLAGHEAEYIHYASSVYYYIKDSLDEAVVTIGDSNAATTKTADWTRTAAETDYAPAYTGSQITPSVTVKIGDQTLQQGIDYSVTYGRNIEAGDAYLTITGQGTTYGTEQHTMKVNFTIVPRSIDSDSLKVTAAERTYSGKAQTLTSTEYYVLKDSSNSASAHLTEASLTSAEQSQADAGTGADTIAKNHPNADFYLSYDSDKTNAGTVKVTAHGINNYTGTSSGSYEIGRLTMVDKKDGGDFSIDDIPEQTYTGSEVVPTDAAITVRYKTKILNKGTDYTVKYSNNTALSTDKNPAVVTITGAGNYTGSIKGTFKIIPRSLSDGTFEYMIGTTAWAPLNGSGKTNVSSLQLPYTGKEDTSKLTISIRSRTSPTNVLKQGEKNDFVVDIPKDYSVGLHTITVTGKGKYAGSTAKIAYRIVASSLDKVSNLRLVSVKSDTDASGKVLSSAGILVTGKDIKRYYQVVYGTKGDPVPVVSGSSINYTYSWQTPDGKDAGEVPTIAGTGYTVTLTGNGNYKGKVTLSEAYDSTSLTSTKQPLMVGASLSVDDVIGIVDATTVKGGGDINNPHSVKYLGANMPQVYLDPNYIKTTNNINNNIDGTISSLSGPTYTNGQYNNNTGDYRVYFVPADTTDDTYSTATKLTSLNAGDTFKVAVEAAPNSTKYFGWHLSGVIKVVPRELSTFGNGGSAKGTLTVTDQNNTSAGSYKVTDGTKDTTNDKLSYEYTGGTITPNLKVVFKPTSQKSDVFTGSFVAIDLSAYSQSIDPATISADAIKSGNISVKAGAVGSDKATECFSGSLSVPYEIKAKEITADNAEIYLQKTSVPYDGQSHKKDIVPVVKIGSNTLEKGVDYSVEYYLDESCSAEIPTDSDSAYTNAGKIYVKIMPGSKDSKYTLPPDGIKISTPFVINGEDISAATVTLGTQTTSPNYAEKYKDSEITPEPTVTLGNTELTKDTDYEVAYSNNTEIGVATVTITGKGNYTGTATQQFYIYASLKNATATGIKDGGTYVIKSKGKPEDDKGNIVDYTDVSFKVGNKTLEKDTNYSVTVTHNDGTAAKYGLAEPGKYIITYTGLGIDHYCDSDTSESVTYSVTILGDIKNFATISGYSSVYDYTGTKPYGPQNSKDIKIKLTGGYRVLPDAYTIVPNKNNTPSSEKNTQPYFTIKIADSYKDYYIADTGDTLDVPFAIKYNLQRATIKLKADEEAPVYGEGEDDVDELKDKIEVTYPGITGTLPTEAYQVTGAVWKTVGSSNKAQLVITISPDEGEVLSYNTRTKTIDGSWKSLGTPTIAGDTTAEYDNQDHYADFKSVISVSADDGATLSEGADYTVQFRKADSSGNYSATGTIDSKLHDAGKYYAEIKGLGAYHTDKPIVLKDAGQVFIVNPKNISTSTMDLVDKNVKYYSGADPEAQYTVTDTELNAVLKENTDYTIAHTETAPAGGNLWDVGTVITYTVTGTGNYTGTNTATVTIEAADLSKDGVIAIEDNKADYDGTEHTPKFTVYRTTGTTKVKLGQDDYTLKAQDSTITSFVNAGEYKYTITGQKNYTGTKELTFTINPRPLTSTEIKAELDKTVWEYTGRAITPTATVTDSLSTINKNLTEGTDFTATPSNNVDSHSATEAGAPTVTIKGENNYTGELTLTFQIGKDIADETVTLSKTSQDYAPDTPFRPTVTAIGSYTASTTTSVTDVADVKYQTTTGTTLNQNEPVNAGSYQVLLTGKGPFFGTKTVSYKIKAMETERTDIKADIVEDGANGQQVDDYGDVYYYYSGKAITPKVTVTYRPDPDEAGITLTESTTADHSDGDYYLEYKKNTNAGDAEIYVHLCGNYSSSAVKKVDFTIKKVDISDFTLTLAKKTAAYTGKAVTRDFTLEGTNEAGQTFSWDSEGKTATQLKSEGIEAEWKANIAPGTATLTVSGVGGNFTGTTDQASLKIQASLDDATITPTEVFRTGEALSPEITLHFEDKDRKDHPVTADSGWFRVTSYEPVDGDWSTATKMRVTVVHTAAGEDYLEGTGKYDITLTDTPPDLTIDGYDPTYKYTGARIVPKDLTVKTGGKDLPSGATVSFSFKSTADGTACIKPGKVTITATVTYGGKTETVTAGKYSTVGNEKPATFTIVPRPIKACTFQGPSDARYTGSAVTPIFSINTGYTQLRYGTDYNYTVRNNVKPGNAIVTIKGQGNYVGTTTKVFHIYVAPVTGLTSSGRSGTTAVIRWNRSGTADGYRVTYTSTRGVRKMLITSGTANNYKLTDLGAGSTQVLVEAYVAGSSGQPIAYSAPESIYVR